MKTIEYQEDWGECNSVSHPYFNEEAPEELPKYLIDSLNGMDDDQRQDVQDLLCLMLKKVLTIIVNPKARPKKKSSGIASRAALLHRLVCNPEMNTRDIPEAYGVPVNAIFDELPYLEKELRTIAKLLH